jgi:hypothetical protein
MAVNALGMTDDALSDAFERKTKEPRVQVAEATSSTASDAGGGQTLTPKQKTAEAEIGKLEAQRELASAEKAQSEGKAAAEKARQAAIYEQYKPELTKKFDTFQPTKDTFQGLASIGMMMMAVGSMSGKKGLTSATGAMNAIAGMATGYQQGRKEEFDRQKAIFDENYKIMKDNQAQIEKEFQYALKYAKADLTGATNKLIQSRTAAGDTATVESLKKNGLVSTINQQTQGARSGLSKIEEAKNKVFEAEKEVIRAKAAETETKGAKNYLVNGKVELLTEPEAMARKSAGAEVQLAGSTSMRLGAPLTDESQEKLAQAVANYSLDPKTLSVKDRAAVLERAIALNPEYQQGDFGNRNLAQRNWVQPNGAGAKQIAAFTTVAQHLDTLQELADAQKNGDTPKINSMINYFNKNLGYPEVTNFDTAKQAVAAEVVKAITGTAGALADRQEAERALSAAASPEQVKGAVETLKKLIGGRIETSRALYTAGTGRSADEFNKLLPENVRESFSKYSPSLKTEEKKPKQNLGKPTKEILDQANAAIQKGAKRSDVLKKMEDAGYDITGLE